MADKYQENNLIFCQKNVKAIDNSNLTRRFRSLADANGYEDLRFHDLRHTHASLMLIAGEQLHVVQQRLGHEKPSTTADIYGHAIPGQ
ncbi:MAG: tyrosine-type recombinase/integrase [Syntrophomonadaceae bacterium]|nr:tyrosine-type recombinase/integrase [Syntrophomonadaceae bacterium]